MVEPVGLNIDLGPLERALSRRLSRRQSLRIGVAAAAAAALLAACDDTAAQPAPAVVQAAPQPTTAATAPVTATEPAEPLVVDDPWGVVRIDPGDPVRIGFAGVLSGELAAIGEDVLWGAQLGVEDLNQIHGFRVELDSQDSLCSGEGGTAVANKFAADETILGVVGHTCSSSSIPAAAIYQRAGIPMISPSSTAVEFTAQGLDVSNRVCWNDAIQGEVAAEFARNTLAVGKAALVHDQSPYGEGLVRVFETAFVNAGGEITQTEGLTVGEDDFRSLLTLLSADPPDLIYFGGFHPEAAQLAIQRKQVGLSETILFGADGIFSPEFIELAGPDAEGVYASGADLAESDPQKLADFEARYLERFNVDQLQGPFSAHGYDAAVVLLTAIRAASQLDTDGSLLIRRKAINDAIRATVGHEGLTGTISCDANGDCGSGSVAFQIVAGGEWTPV